MKLIRLLTVSNLLYQKLYKVVNIASFVYYGKTRIGMAIGTGIGVGEWKQIYEGGNRLDVQTETLEALLFNVSK